MKATRKEVQMTVKEQHERSGYRADVHPVLVSYFAQEGLTDAQIASRLHISRQTLYTWRNRHPELAAALKDSKELADARVVESLFRQALKGNVTACIFYLANRVPSRWSRNGREVEVRVAASAKTDVTTEEMIRMFSGAVHSAVEQDSGCTP